MNFKDYETKWQNYWEDNKIYRVDTSDIKKKKYILDMFPYPSGAGLHVGHTEGYTGSDILTRYYKMKGYNVLHPMGWDAFGLPAEQYALDTGNDPREFTEMNIANFKRQAKAVGLVYDWDRELRTTDPKFYKWTQWIFIQLYNQGLAEVKEMSVNWCDGLGTVLSNEEIVNVNGKMVSERGNFPVVKKNMKQWALKIPQYAERLLNDLDDLDWPDSIKEMQRNWIGKSVGASVFFGCENHDIKLEVFTTRPDTLFGCSYMVIAPEHDFVKQLTTEDNLKEVEQYVYESSQKSELERTDLIKDKTGVFTGSYAINPVNGKKIPIWISNYVLASYGTGIVMAVPGHDTRDYEFASKFNLPIIQVVEGDISTEAYTGDGIHINSDFLDGLNNVEAINKMNEWLEEKGVGSKQVNYKLRDWIFARQRYWGEPFPVIHWEDGTISIEENLPLELPILEKIEPSGTAESPLVNATEWINVVREDGVKGKRDSNTMPQWAGSCWYYIGYLLTKIDGSLIPLDSEEAKKILSDWLPVDFYIGGAEHAVLHLLYSRFWHKVLYDVGVVDTIEPFQRLFNQGMILGSDNEKMSKSKGNVVSPEDVIKEYGADTLRMYEMFMGPLEATKPWSSEGVAGIYKYLERVNRMFESFEITDEDELDFEYNVMVKKVGSDIENIKFNTAISTMMTFTNEVYKSKKISKGHALGFIKCLFPIAPHIAEEINEKYELSSDSLAISDFPQYDDSKIVQSTMTIVVQVNGKLRARLDVDVNISADEILQLAKSNEDVIKFTDGLEIVKEIYVPNKLVNIVVK